MSERRMSPREVQERLQALAKEREEMARHLEERISKKEKLADGYREDIRKIESGEIKPDDAGRLLERFRRNLASIEEGIQRDKQLVAEYRKDLLHDNRSSDERLADIRQVAMDSVADIKNLERDIEGSRQRIAEYQARIEAIKSGQIIHQDDTYLNSLPPNEAETEREEVIAHLEQMIRQSEQAIDLINKGITESTKTAEMAFVVRDFMEERLNPPDQDLDDEEGKAKSDPKVH